MQPFTTVTARRDSAAQLSSLYLPGRSRRSSNKPASRRLAGCEEWRRRAKTGVPGEGLGESKYMPDAPAAGGRGHRVTRVPEGILARRLAALIAQTQRPSVSDRAPTPNLKKVDLNHKSSDKSGNLRRRLGACPLHLPDIHTAIHPM